MRFTHRLPDWLAGTPLEQPKNLRLAVFTIVFLLGTVGGLLVNYTRTAEYRAGARVEIVPAEKLAGEGSAPVVVHDSGPAAPFLTEVQLLTARAALEQVAQRLPRAGFGDGLNARDGVGACNA